MRKEGGDADCGRVISQEAGSYRRPSHDGESEGNAAHGRLARLIARDRAPTKMRLKAQVASRLNQLRDTNLRPTKRQTSTARNPPATIIAIEWTRETRAAMPRLAFMSALAASWPLSRSAARHSPR